MILHINEAINYVYKKYVLLQKATNEKLSGRYIQNTRINNHKDGNKT